MGYWSLGVDLGTSYCVGAVATDHAVGVLEVSGESRVPSTVLNTDDGTLLAGRAAQRSSGRMPERTERNPKRYVGRASPMLLGGRPVNAAEALAALLTLFVDEGRRNFDGEDPDSLVLTHPAAWSSDQRDLLVGVAGRALPQVPCRLLPEPVAAAWYYATDRAITPGESVAVYDLGGGTFDAAVVRATGTGFDVLGSDGDPEIGGENFDSLIYGHFGEQLATVVPQWWDGVVRGTDRQSLSLAIDLLEEARRAKEELSQYPYSEHFVRGAAMDVRIDRHTFESMIAADVERTGRLLGEVIAGSRADNLSGIFLTGGASRIPMVASRLRPVYGDIVRTWQNPKAAVALGAARWARLREAGTVSRSPLGVPASPRGPARSAPASSGIAPGMPVSVPVAVPANGHGTSDAGRAWRLVAGAPHGGPVPAVTPAPVPTQRNNTGPIVIVLGILVLLTGVLVQVAILLFLGLAVAITGVVLEVRRRRTIPDVSNGSSIGPPPC